MNLLLRTKRRASMLLALLSENSFFVVAGHLIKSRLGIGLGLSDTMKVHGFTLKLRRGSPDLAVALTSLGGEFDCLDEYFDTNFNGLIIDAGGYIGTAALAFSKAFPNARIISVEASSSNAKLAAHNTASFPNIEVIHAAVTADHEIKEIMLYDRSTGAWGYTILHDAFDRPTTQLETVRTITIDQLMEMSGFAEVSILKLDIEGAELRLLQSPDWLEATLVLVAELHERIAPGCEAAFIMATADRVNVRHDGEKHISMKRVLS